jgi:hypothetical protein
MTTDKFSEREREIVRKGILFIDPKKYIEDYLKTHSICISLSGTLIDPENRPRPLIESAISRAALQDYLDYSNIPKYHGLPRILQLTKDSIRDSLDEVIFEQRVQQAKALSSHLACEQEDLTEIKKWVHALNPNHTELDVYKAAHFIWQVKRKLAGLPTKWESLLHLYSRDQGFGKSWAIRYLLGPLAPAVIYSKLTTFCDDRSSGALARNYAAFIDEIDWPTKDSVEYLKTIITSPQVSYRPMRTNEVHTVPNNVTLITAANRQIYEIINDSSGNRRYLQITVPQKVDWDLIHKIDYLKLYRGVNEKIEDGYSTILQDELTKELSEMVVKEDIEVFIDDLHLIPKENSKTILLDDLYVAYSDYCSVNGYKEPMNKKWFSRKLNLRGVKTKRLIIDKERCQVIVVDTQCPVLEMGKKKLFTISKELA